MNDQDCSLREQSTLSLSLSLPLPLPLPAFPSWFKKNQKPVTVTATVTTTQMHPDMTEIPKNDKLWQFYSWLPDTMITITQAALTLFFVMDPLGNVPVFLSILKHAPAKKRPFIILRESFIAYLFLLIFLLFGQYLLQSMHISQPALAIAGGIILFLIAIRMIFPPESADNIRQVGEPFIVPLAVPMIAGPSTMTMVMLLSHQAPDEMLHWIIALTIAWSVTTIILVFAESLRKILGERGLTAVERLMGMILTTMAVQLFLTGFEQFLHN